MSLLNVMLQVTDVSQAANFSLSHLGGAIELV